MNRITLFLMALITATITLSSCKKNNDPVLPIDPTPTSGEHGLLWSLNLGIGSLEDITPAISPNNEIFFAMSDVATSEIVAFGVDKDGNKLWQTPVDGISSSKVIYHNNKIFFSTSYPSGIYCLDANSGSIEWKYDLGDEYDFDDLPALALKNETLYVNSGTYFEGYIIAYNLDGSEKFMKKVRRGINISIDGNALYYSSTDSIYKYTISETDCTKEWGIQLPELQTLKSDNGMTALYDLPIGENGNIYIRSENGVSVISPEGTLVNDISFVNQFDHSYSNITLTENNEIIMGDNDGDLCKISTDGSLIWKTQITGLITSPFFANAATIADNGSFYDAQLFGLFCIKNDGELSWQESPESGATEHHGNLHPPVLNHEGNIISVAAEANELRCFKGDGKKLASKGWPKPYANHENTSAR